MSGKTLAHTLGRFTFVDLGFGDYEDLFGRVRAHHAKRTQGKGTDTLFLAEHPPVYTLGKRLQAIECFFDQAAAAAGSVGGAPVIQTDRGGLATYHGPGQLMLYPVVALRPAERAVHGIVDALERIAIVVAARFGVQAFARPEARGAWVRSAANETPAKLASIGLAIRRSVTLHGMGLNICVDPAAFGALDPCGIPDAPIANLAELSDRGVSMDEAKAAVVEAWPEVWNALTASCDPRS